MILRPRTRVRSIFAISGFNCEPEKITSLLSITPTRTSTEAPDRSGFRYWEFETDVDSVFVEDHIAAVIEKLGPRATTLRESSLFHSDMVEMITFIIAKVSEVDIGLRMCLSPETSKLLADMKISLVIDG